MTHLLLSICNKKVKLLILTLLVSTSLLAQKNEAKDFQVDSVLYIYYQQCKEHLQLPVVISMADTLFHMAGEKGDQRMQAVALSTVLDYYYYNGEIDSIIVQTNRVKDFARKTNQPKYYYFAWGKRLIQFYIKKGMTNTALYEAEAMMKEATKAGDKEGLANCYNTLSSIYLLRKADKQALESMQKEVELIETFGLDRYNLTVTYCNMAKEYLIFKDLPKALEALQKAEAASYSSSNEFLYKLQYVHYYLSANQPEKAFEYLTEVRQAFNTDKRLSVARKSLLEAESAYYRATGEYVKALEANEENFEEQKSMGEINTNINLLRARGDLYQLLGNKDKALQYLTDYISARDSVDSVNEENAATEFSALLGMEKLNVEKKEMEMQNQKKQLQSTRTIVFLLVAFLLIGIAFFYREIHLNKALKSSKNELLRKNLELTKSEEELSIAKDRAEKASHMKTAFIRTMTHEIRTPLNSIVGFSQVISSQAAEEESQEFAAIIEDNSNKLLKLVDDVLDISNLESGEILNISDTDINNCCFQSINKVQPFVKEGVKIEFHSAYEKLITRTDSGRVSQILFNLLHNAARATEKGSITLNYVLSADKKELVFTITDTGTGIPEDKQEEVFERFVKLDDFSQGFGLGLPICRMLLQMMGGDLHLDKTYTAGGCRFVFTIPYHEK